ncbi:RNA polymerase sigma factor [Amycolatopsis rhizosphaerae]|uniref:RNA polymerase sigma factor n=1 Tax=Amycolatopsis rhizosphaerae TaxID=2053003 RepID=A0A558AQH4_9PSEU|nr:RNA polymerase sigma factor [Amycolatopsis rhizosphaerae]TVT26498.1 RNA polymerase sigma factor [Amycolatopsis rhizosphaerae]
MPDRPKRDSDDSPAGRSGFDLELDIVVMGAQSGDENSVRHLYRALQPRLLNYLRVMVGETDAEDVASETWSRVARDLRSFRGNGQDFRAWIVTIARHRAIDHLRRRRPTTPLAPHDIPHQTARNETERDAINAINTASALAIIAGLPPDQAQAILLRVVIGLDTPTASRVLGKNPGALRMAVHRGLRNLAKRIQATPGDQHDQPPIPSAPTTPYRSMEPT